VRCFAVEEWLVEPSRFAVIAIKHFDDFDPRLAAIEM
jgi:hypothetical protein